MLRMELESQEMEEELERFGRVPVLVDKPKRPAIHLSITFRVDDDMPFIRFYNASETEHECAVCLRAIGMDGGWLNLGQGEMYHPDCVCVER